MKQLVVCAITVLLTSASTLASWDFVDVTQQAGFNYTHGYVGGPGQGCIYTIAGGVAVGDYDRDGWIDVYVVRGNTGPNLLYRNKGDGTFEEVGAAAGVNLTGPWVGPVFADYDGDGWLDLLMGSNLNQRINLFRNRGDGTFEDVSFASGLLVAHQETWSGAFGDYDRDGDLDLALGHWTQSVGPTPGNHLWRNEGNGSFTAADGAAGITGYSLLDFTFTPNFADVNNDGWPDLLMTSDFNTSRYFLNNTDGTFTDATTSVISDENGMGAAIGDYDNDGDLDWFVTAIQNPPSSAMASGEMPTRVRPSGTNPAEFERDKSSGGDATESVAFTGNRLYCNQGGGTFADCTAAAGVQYGYWGWAASFQDFNNDGHLDLFHVNGFYGQPADPSRMYVSNGNGTFNEDAIALGINGYSDGRGVACFDYDRDGDLDVFIASNSSPPTLYRNDGGNDLNHLTVKLNGQGANTEGIGSRVYVTLGTTTQMRELRAGSNFSSQDAAEAHFGLGTATTIDEVRVEWLDGTSTVMTNVAANQRMTLCPAPGSNTPDTDGDGVGDGCDNCPLTPNTGQEIVGFGTVLATSQSTFEWVGATGYASARGNFVSSSDIGSFVADQTSSGTGSVLTDGATPGAGEGLWYLLRIDCAGSTWSTDGSGELTGRDATLP